MKNIVSPNREIGEGKGFYADLYINGIKAGHTKNEGEYTVYRPECPVGEELIEAAQKYFESIPYEIITLSSRINELFLCHEVMIRERKVKYFNSEMEKQAIIVFEAHSNLYRKLELKIPLDCLNETANAEKTLFRIMNVFVVPFMQAGDRVMNKNLPAVVAEAMAKYSRKLIYYPNPLSNLSSRRIFPSALSKSKRKPRP